MRCLLGVALLFLPIPLTAGTVYFPQVADGGGYLTTFTIINPTTSSAIGTDRLIDADICWDNDQRPSVTPGKRCDPKADPVNFDLSRIFRLTPCEDQWHILMTGTTCFGQGCEPVPWNWDIFRNFDYGVDDDPSKFRIRTVSADGKINTIEGHILSENQIERSWTIP